MCCKGRQLYNEGDKSGRSQNPKKSVRISVVESSNSENGHESDYRESRETQELM
jgi:hypothetical protein